jgi:hypothetical protein
MKMPAAGYLALSIALLVGTSCARQTGAAGALENGGSFTDVAAAADALQPEPAELDFQLTGCPGGAMSVKRYGNSQYIWRGPKAPDGAIAGGWRSRAEFMDGIRASWRGWNECTSMAVYFGCTPGLDTKLGATAECGQSVHLTRAADGRITIAPAVTHVN